MSKQLSDQQVHAAIVALRKNQVKLTGSVVREELRRRYGAPGGVSRIYRVLQNMQSKTSSLDYQEIVAENAELKAKLVEAFRRAEIAEQREDTHQLRWAAEVESLRHQLREALVERRLIRQLQDQVLELHRRIHRMSGPTVE